ncbi:hypothetical protein [uncultured Polaribacter sp.]|uniref:hypothetical protein n=1 Tax=uncultured Polaribacter sp. TaxID=174711 RepID=UPI0026312CF0|nr:hypothetical protein [uncultured Polaribacter sp.]
MKIKKDNLTPEQKRKAYFGIVFLSIILFSFFYYANYLKKSTKELLSKNTELTICKIIGYSSYKGNTDIIKYTVNSKKYERELSARGTVEIGEFYELKYSKIKPDICEVNYKKPKIYNVENYIKITGIISNTYENEKYKILTYEYKYQKENYERDIYLYSLENYEKGKKIEIIVNRKNPKISYLTKQIE